MDASNDTVHSGIGPLSDDDKFKNLGRQAVGKIVLPDECGDTLWDDVLGENKNLTTELNKLSNTVADSDDRVEEGANEGK